MTKEPLPFILQLAQYSKIQRRYVISEYVKLQIIVTIVVIDALDYTKHLDNDLCDDVHSTFFDLTQYSLENPLIEKKEGFPLFLKPVHCTR